MIKTFYQFRTADHARVAVVSSGDEDAARAFLVDPKLGGLDAHSVGLSPCVVQGLPEDMRIEPLDAGKMPTCWAGWRVTDFVYGLGDGKRLSDADGIVVLFAEGDLGPRTMNVRMACARALITRSATRDELVALCTRAGLSAARIRVAFALLVLRNAGRVTELEGVWMAEVRA